MMIEELIREAEQQLMEQFRNIEETEAYWTQRILAAYRQYEISYRHFSGTTGYGNGDIGREALENVFADVFGTEAAIVRPSIASGTAALAMAVFGLSKPGETIVSATGRPYDTMEEVLGITQEHITGSLHEYGVGYRQVDLSEDGHIDLNAVDASIDENVHLVIAQRSRGYSWRSSIMPEEFGPLAEMIHAKHPGVVLMVDNCYGEFVTDTEPSMHGADVCVGSLIKNPGGGLAPTGGYMVGTREAIERIAARVTAPGIGLEVGSYVPGYQSFFQGLFMAPHTVAQALKTACPASRIFTSLGFATSPAPEENRSDIIQAIRLETPEQLIRFCQGIQMASPIDSMAMPEPWDMPGYTDQVIMAAGTFVAGASIELSADGPMRPPYIAYLQGSLTYIHGRIALQEALKHMQKH